MCDVSWSQKLYEPIKTHHTLCMMKINDVTCTYLTKKRKNKRKRKYMSEKKTVIEVNKIQIKRSDQREINLKAEK